MKLVFCLQISVKVSYKLILWFFMEMVNYSQSSQNSKFRMPLQYLIKEVRDEIDFFHTDKHQSFLQVDFNTLGIKVSYKVILPLLMGIIKNSEVTQQGIIQKNMGTLVFSKTKNGSWISWECCKPPSGGQEAKPPQKIWILSFKAQ